MQIPVIELGQRRERRPVANGEPSAVPHNHPPPPQFLHHTVDVHRRNAQRIGQRRLGDRQLKAAVAGAADDLETSVEFTDQMCGALDRKSVV